MTCIALIISETTTVRPQIKTSAAKNDRKGFRSGGEEREVTMKLETSLETDAPEVLQY